LFFLSSTGRQTTKSRERSEEGKKTKKKAGDMAIDLKMSLVFEVGKLPKGALTLQNLKLRQSKIARSTLEIEAVNFKK